ncbi:YybH family protein [Labrys monachus]|uniref:Ketosteroid isomerase-like protein n=1 Tax=Labrys monachus TaxID=217067 RepID=A0ABU0FGH1_9HYPH|nr:nuclear transport factor 2 family protein [Labrys monachus]MDQ0393437.1 ketosteroid isomerase-like protein [Labrys monachus]
MTTRRSRFALNTLSAAALLALCIPSVGRADDADVKAAIDANHAAIHSLNIGDIVNVWSHGADVTLVNPGDSTVAVGWDAVKGRWENVFKILSSVDIKQTDGPYVTTTGDIARSVGIVHVTLHFKSRDTKEVNFVETDVFLKQEGHWLVVSHTAKPI